MACNPLTVAWISDFPIEWLPDSPKEVRLLQRQHPLSWQRVLLAELEKNSALQIHVLVLRKGIERSLTFQLHGVHFHLLKTRAGFRASSFFWLDTWLIRQCLKKIRPDLIHAWGTERGAALVASRLGYPYLVTLQGLLSWLGELVPLNAYQRFAAFLERFSLPRAPAITTESSFAVKYLERAYSHPRVIQIEHAPNWLFHEIRRQPQLKPFRFIFVGTLSHMKGVDLLLKALDCLKAEIPFELILVGSPDSAKYLHQLRNMTSAELWQSIRHYDSLTPEEVAQELALATMLLFPTRADNSPNAVKEAVVAGVPVVASRIGGIPDYVYAGQNGLLFTSEGFDGLVQALKSACQHPLFSRGEVAPEALTKARDYLTPPRMGKSFADLYRNLCQNSTICKSR